MRETDDGRPRARSLIARHSISCVRHTHVIVRRAQSELFTGKRTPTGFRKPYIRVSTHVQQKYSVHKRERERE